MSNNLQSESSPYLLQHADNPVEWHPWGSEAFELARELDKPIFLSIGYAACHWCHVMAHESFEDPATAELMNSGFVNIKVDREERPDVDSIYMNAVIAITGQGGWPLSVFLTPEGKPFYGGTYFPPTRRYNMPSFQEIMYYLLDLWNTDRSRLIQSGEQLTENLHPPALPTIDDFSLEQTTLDQAARSLFDQYDWQDGGWGSAPKFPASSAIELLLRRFHRHSDNLALDMATHALGHMRRGGIYDQIGGGFHRYSVDKHWLVPHFEKMLYDNALLIRTYLHHWQLTREQASRDIVEQTIDFLIREMRDDAGGYYSSLDADSEGEEGTFYLWDLEQVRQACPEPALADFALQAYGISAEGNFEGRNILTQAQPLLSLATDFELDEGSARERLSIIRAGLLEKRNTRIRPATDDKIITAWNGLLLIALAESARALARPDILELAQALAAFMLDELTVEGRLQRSWRRGEARFTAYLEDHAALGLGLLALYQADFNPRWMMAAREHGHEILQHFIDDQGGFFDTRADHETLITRPKTIQDSPTPSGNAMAVDLFLQLAALDGQEPWTDPAVQAIAMMQEQASRYPSAFAGWLNALDIALHTQIQIAVAGDPSSEEFFNLISIFDRAYLPGLVAAGGDPASVNAPMLLTSRPVPEDNATAYLCQGFHCQMPTQSPAVLDDQLKSALSPKALGQK
jgi:uncharacterized protein YyaL (SSP411 family)